MITKIKLPVFPPPQPSNLVSLDALVWLFLLLHFETQRRRDLEPWVLHTDVVGTDHMEVEHTEVVGTDLESH